MPVGRKHIDPVKQRQSLFIRLHRRQPAAKGFPARTVQPQNLCIALHLSAQIMQTGQGKGGIVGKKHMAVPIHLRRGGKGYMQITILFFKGNSLIQMQHPFHKRINLIPQRILFPAVFIKPGEVHGYEKLRPQNGIPEAPFGGCPGSVRRHHGRDVDRIPDAE